jgi:mono/diheme cytochrome c family protein
MTLDTKRILVPLDISASSHRALDYAHGLALKFDAALHLRSSVAGIVASMLVASVMLAPGLVTTATAQDYAQTTTGREVFRTYCASCHGISARGDGVLAGAMNRKPSNLTEIARRNGGQFPSDVVFRTIDGRQPVRGHGGPDMPVWGDVFTKSRDAGDAERVKAVIQSLVQYLDSIQLRPAHEQ